MIKNQIKTILLFIGQLIGGFTGLTTALVLAIVMNVGSFLWSHKIVLAMYRAKEIKENENPELHQIVREVAQEAKVPKPKIYLIPSENANAFCTGPSPKKAVLGYTKGILRLLNKDELKGVTAHEIAHDKNRDMLITTIAATIGAVISYVAFMARFAAIFGGARDERNGSNIIALLALVILAPIAALIIQLAISRS